MERKIAEMTKDELELYRRQLQEKLAEVNFFLRGQSSHCIPDKNAEQIFLKINY